MTTIDPPAPLVFLPTLSQIWRAVKTDRPVAITALVCATVAFLGLLWTFSRAGDAAVIAAAVGTVLSAGTFAYARIRNGNGKTPPE